MSYPTATHDDDDVHVIDLRFAPNPKDEPSVIPRACAAPHVAGLPTNTSGRKFPSSPTATHDDADTQTTDSSLPSDPNDAPSAISRAWAGPHVAGFPTS